MSFERDSAAGFGLENIAIFGRDGVDAEVPDAQVDGFVREYLHQGKLAEVEGLFWGYFEPVASG